MAKMPFILISGRIINSNSTDGKHHVTRHFTFQLLPGLAVDLPLVKQCQTWLAGESSIDIEFDDFPRGKPILRSGCPARHV